MSAGQEDAEQQHENTENTVRPPWPPTPASNTNSSTTLTEQTSLTPNEEYFDTYFTDEKIPIPESENVSISEKDR